MNLVIVRLELSHIPQNGDKRRPTQVLIEVLGLVRKYRPRGFIRGFVRFRDRPQHNIICLVFTRYRSPRVHQFGETIASRVIESCSQVQEAKIFMEDVPEYSA